MVNRLYPLYLKLAGRRVLVVGGGRVALRRVKSLLEGGAQVTVVSPELAPELADLAAAEKLAWIERRFEARDLHGAEMVFLATGQPDLARDIRAAIGGGKLLNSAEDESLSDFHVPAVAAWLGVEVAVSTGGKSPAAAARIRDRMQNWLEANDGFLREALAAGRAGTLGAELAPETAQREPPRSREAQAGKVYLVGAGPGNPDLLTLRAAALLDTAEVVFYDRLVSAAILERLPARVEKVYVGKEVGCAERANVEKLLVERARAGKRVVRLKGGDPLVFGRGGEEMLALKRAGVDYEVVPGVSALSSVPGAAGIPVTFRGVASEIVVRSGHCAGNLDPDREGEDAPLEAAAPGAGAARARRAGARERTYVYFMAARRLAQVVDDLLAEGLPASTPVAVIQKGTLPGQKVLTSDLENILAAAERQPLETPALVVAGEVVKFRNLEEFLTLLESYVLGERR